MKSTICLVFILSAVTWLAAQSEPSGFTKYPPAPAAAPRLLVPIGHTDNIISAAISPDDQFVVTGSQDNAAILWNTSGKELQRFKSGDDAIFAVTFLYTGNEKYIATGDQGGRITLWDLKGNMISAFSMSLNRQESAMWIRQMTFSTDGKKVNIKDRYGETTVDVLTGEKTEAFETAAPKPIPANIPSDPTPVFSPGANGKFILSFSEMSATLWSMDGKKIQTFGSNSMFSPVELVAFSPDDSSKKVLVQSSNGISRLWDLAEGAPNQSFNQHTAFSPDWKYIVRYDEKAQKSVLSAINGNPIQTFEGRYLTFSPDGKSLLSSWEKGAKEWDISTGKERRFFKPDARKSQEGNFNPMEALNAAAGFISAVYSPVTPGDPSGGKYVLTCHGTNLVEIWNREKNAVLADFKAGDDFLPKQIASSGLAFSPDGKSVLTPGGMASVSRKNADNGEVIDDFRGHHELVRCIATTSTPNGGMLVLTGSEDNTAKLWDPANNVIKNADESFVQERGARVSSRFVGGEIQTYKGHTNDVTAVAFSAATSEDPNGGKYVITGSEDNTAKIWDRASGKELCTLISIGENDWVVTAPSGLFDASPGAMDLMYFVVGTETIELEQLKERYYEPHLLAKIFGLSSDPNRSVETFNTLALYPEMNAQLSSDNLKLQVSLKARSGGMGKLSFFVNGKEVLEDANPNRAASVTLNLMDYARYFLPNTANKLALRVYNQEGWLKSAAKELDYEAPATGRGSATGNNNEPVFSGPPSLYAVIVGTSNYVGDKLDLKFADKDASYFTQAMRVAAPNVFGERVSITLLNTDAKDKTRQDTASKTTIKKAFENIAAKAKAQDVLLVYFAGHGVNYGVAEKADFYYLTKDIASEDLSASDIREKRAISGTEITEWIKKIPALKQVLIFDVCHAGDIVKKLAAGRRDLPSAQIRALDRMKDRTGMFILTGSAADKVSYESTSYGQGLLTYSLLQGMSGLSHPNDENVDVLKLFQYAFEKVPVLAKGIGGVQKPILNIPGNASGFDIGAVKDSKSIPLALEKPVFIAPRMRDVDDGDELNLNETIDAYLSQIAVEGAQASLIYWNINSYENGYSIRGGYDYQGDAVKVKGSLYLGKTLKGKFEVTGKKNDVPGLTEAIMEKAMALIK